MISHPHRFDAVLSRNCWKANIVRYSWGRTVGSVHASMANDALYANIVYIHNNKASAIILILRFIIHSRTTYKWCIYLLYVWSWWHWPTNAYYNTSIVIVDIMMMMVGFPQTFACWLAWQDEATMSALYMSRISVAKHIDIVFALQLHNNNCNAWDG